MEEKDGGRTGLFVKLCRAHRLRVTPQRLAVFRSIAGSRTHPSAEAVYRSVKQDIPGITFDTVNRTLLTFVDAGIVRLVEGLDRHRRFDPRTDTHHHFLCIRCGTIFDFDDAGYDALEIGDGLKKQFRIFSKRVVLQGLCETCLRAEKRHREYRTKTDRDTTKKETTG